MPARRLPRPTRRSSSILDNPEHWRGRANAARLVAEQLDDPEAKATMLTIAEQYDRLAKAAQQRAEGHE